MVELSKKRFDLGQEEPVYAVNTRSNQEIDLGYVFASSLAMLSCAFN